MIRDHNPGSLWGPGLIIVALLMVVAGYLGGPVFEKQEKERQKESANQDAREIGKIWNIQTAILKQELRMLGPQELRFGNGSSSRFDPIFDEKLVHLIGSTVEATTSEIVERFPDRRYIVRARLRYYEYVTSRVHDIDRPEWNSMSPGLPEEALRDPGAFLPSLEYGATSVDHIDFLIPDDLEADEFRKVWDILNTKFRGTPLNIIDVVGNEQPIGIPASVRLICHLEWQELPVGVPGITAAILNRIGLLGLILLLVLPPLWVYLDARKKRLPAPLWGLFALLTSALGALIYALVTREEGPNCPECGERISTRFVVCPYCQTELKGTCSTCGQTVGLNWHYCPSCATEL